MLIQWDLLIISSNHSIVQEHYLFEKSGNELQEEFKSYKLVITL